MEEKWYLRANGEVFGPESREQLISWAKLGRIQPGQEISSDGETWRPAPEIDFLELRWCIDLHDGESPRGPFHRDAAQALLASGRLPPTATLVPAVAEEAPADGPAADGASGELVYDTEEPPVVATAAAVNASAAPRVIEKVRTVEVVKEVPKVVEKVVKVVDPLQAAEIASLKQRLAEKETELSSRDKALAERDAALAARQAELADLRSKITEREAALADRAAASASQQVILAERDATITALKSEIEDLKRTSATKLLEVKTLSDNELSRQRERADAALATARAQHARELAAAEAKRQDEVAAAKKLSDELVAAAKAQGAKALAELRASSDRAKDEAEKEMLSLRGQLADEKASNLELHGELKRLPADAATVANTQAALFVLMQRESASLDAAMAREQREIEDARAFHEARMQALDAQRRELQKRMGADEQDMARRALQVTPEDPRVVRLRQELDAMKVLQEKNAVEADRRIRELSERLRQRDTEVERSNAQMADVTQLARQLTDVRQQLQKREQELLEERQRNEKSRIQAEALQQALQSRLSKLESSEGMLTRQARESHGVRFAPWMGLKG